MSLGLVAAAGVFLAPTAAAEPPPVWAVYGEPGPVPLPDAAAETFVKQAAPELRGVTARELARGVVVTAEGGGEPGSVVPLEPAGSSAASPKGSTPSRPVVEIPLSPGVVDRAGAGQGTRGFDTRWGFLLAALLASGGLVILATGSRPPS